MSKQEVEFKHVYGNDTLTLIFVHCSPIDYSWPSPNQHPLSTPGLTTHDHSPNYHPDPLSHLPKPPF